MKILKQIRQFIFGYTVESRANHTVKIIGITFEHANVQLYRKEGLHEILLLSVWDQPITLCVLLTNDLRQKMYRFFNEAGDQLEAKLAMPLHHQLFGMKLKFNIYNEKNKKRKIIITQGITKKYYTLTDVEIERANNYFKKYVFTQQNHTVQ